MRGIIKGIQPVDYWSEKKQEQIKGLNLNFDYKSKDWFGFASKTEFIKADSPIFVEQLKPYMSDLDKLQGAEIMIDYMSEKRGNYTFTDIVGFELSVKK